MKVQVLTLADTVDAAFCAPHRDQDGPWLPVKRESFFSPGPRHAAKLRAHDAITILEEEPALTLQDSYASPKPAEALHLYAKCRRGGVVLHCAPRKGLQLDTWA